MHLQEMIKVAGIALFSALAVGSVLGLVLRGIVHHAETTERQRRTHVREYVA